MRRYVHPHNLARYARHSSRLTHASTQFPITGSRPCIYYKPIVGTTSVYSPHACGIQRRFLLGPFFRLARSGFTVAAGAAAGGAAYANHKFSEATSSISDRVDKVTNWLGDMFDKVDIPDFLAGTGTGVSQNGENNGSATSTAGASGSGTSSGGGSAGSGGSEGGNSGNTGGSGGPGGTESALGAGALASSVGIRNPADEPDSYDDQINEMDSQMINLTRKMIEIRNLLEQIDGADSVKLPSIVVIGSQSSGKSSVLEGIVGHEFLPKGSNMVTRRPIELTLVHTTGASDYCEFPAMRSGQITNFRDVQRTLTELNLAVPESEVVSAEPIQLRIYSPHVPDLTLIDLPGYIQVVAAGQPLELKSRIADLCEKYIQPPNVILAVSAADVDLANSTALRASRRVDPRGLRTIGVITKMDLVDAERGVEILLNRQYPLRMGYVGVVTRIASHGMSSLFGTDANITKAMADSEKEFFSNPEYQSVNWGILKLRRKLTQVLEKSMADGLEPAKREIRKELEETAYAFKVQYNDRVLTPQSYLAQCADSFKASFQEMSSQFGRDQVRELIKKALDQKGLDLLAETYWNAPPGMSKESGFSLFGSNAAAADSGLDHSQPSLQDMASAKPDLLYWQSKIDGLSGTLTKLGVGRLSTTILVDTIKQRMRNLEASSSFANHPLAIKQVNDATESILSSKFYATADQIENSIKPYKYEVDMDAREWQHSREYAYNLLKEEQRQCDLALAEIKSEVGASKLKTLVKSLESLNPSENLGHFSNELIAKARMAAFLQKRIDVLKARSIFIRSSKCKNSKNKAVCPEVFMDVIAAKLAATAVLFLNFELLSDFYYSFPRELDNRLQALTEEQVEELANQDPAIKRHVSLQHRKELLHLALSKLQTISDMRDIGNER